MLSGRASSYSSSRSGSGRRYRASGYPPSSTFPSFTSYTNGTTPYSSSSSTSSPALASSLGHHHGNEHKAAAASTSAIMSDGHSETSETPTRKRIAVAVQSMHPHSIQVQTTLTDMRHANESGSSTAPNPHLEVGYNMEASRAAAHRGSMPPLQMPTYAVDLSAEVPYQPRPSYSNGYGSRPTAAASSSYYAAGSGTWSGYSTEDEYQTAAPYYAGAMADMSSYGAWGGSSSGSTSGTRSSSRSGPAAGSMYVDPSAPALHHNHHHQHPHHPHHLSSLVHRPAPAITVSAGAAAAAAAAAVTAPMPSAAHLAALPGVCHQGQGIQQSYSAIQYPYPPAAPAGVVGHQSCSVVYMPQPTALRLGSSHFTPDALPHERLTTSPSNSPSPHSQPADAAAPPAAPYSVQHMVKTETSASPGPNSNRASTTSPACSSGTPRTSIGSVGGQEDQRSREGEVKEDEEELQQQQQQQQQQEHKQDRADNSPTATTTTTTTTTTGMPEVANHVPHAIFSDAMHGPSMAGYEYGDSANSSPYHGHAGPSTAASGSSPAPASHRRGISSSMAAGSAYASLPTPPPPSSSSHHHHHHQHHSHHGAAATAGHHSAYNYSHYQGSGYHHHAAAAPEHHHHAADHHRSPLGQRR
ncbi:uncharacterized protein PpBr36_10704 [Pyricularia pennisetigena]|uniref:uncharacterized protein n=1 Tax=Pyricularia pennisetigena TaxID=1578925 RepID=UPI00114E3FCB|nr:uncharacterized protein PpBr36_10704 [Pyricularia pennisetigena]TLS21040.1 hypothetical protein PpBr36_10704 [Pyricularia pennisetigena]